MKRHRISPARRVCLSNGGDVMVFVVPEMYVDELQGNIDLVNMTVSNGGVLSRYDSAQYRPPVAPMVEKKLTGPYNVIGGNTNFGHWIFENMARLAVFDAAGMLGERMILVADGTPRRFTELLDLIKVDWVAQPSAWVRGAYMPSPPFYRDNDGPKVWPSALHWLRMKLSPHTTPKTGGRVIYAPRVGATHRRVLNDDALVEGLSKRGVEIVHWEGMSVADQVRTVRECDTMISPVGAGAQLGWFCDGHVIELCNPLMDALWAGKIGCMINGTRYTRVVGHPTGSGIDSDYAVPVEAVLRAVG